MPADLWTDAVRMAGCGLVVAAVAAPVGLLCGVAARRKRVPLLPSPQPWRVPWTGFEVFVAFFVLQLAVPAVVYVLLTKAAFFPALYGPQFPPSVPDVGAGVPVEAAAAVAGLPAATSAAEHQVELSAVRNLWTGIWALPVQLGLLVALRYTLYPAWQSPADMRTVPARIALGVAVWAVLTPIVLAVHAAVTVAFTALDLPPEDHPLSKLSAARPILDRVLLFVQAGIAAPVVEEVLFRGLLLGWLVSGRIAFVRPPDHSRNPAPTAAERRVGSVLVLGVALAALTAKVSSDWTESLNRGPVLFAAALAIGWGAVRLVFRRKRRTAGAVYASAVLFAAVHSGVWPSPIPLFVLGLGLGWLAVRTRGVAAPIVVHGLFNTVSALFVLRNSAIG